MIACFQQAMQFGRVPVGDLLGEHFQERLWLLNPFDDELNVFCLHGLAARVSSECSSFFADTDSILFQDSPHLFDRVVSNSLRSCLFDQPADGGRGKFTVSHQNNQKRLSNCRFY